MRAIWGLAVVITGCAHGPQFTVMRPQLDQVKSVAVVQFVEDWGHSRLTLGTSVIDEARQKTIVQSYDYLVADLGSRFRVLPRDAVMRNPGYQDLSTTQEDSRCWIPKGFRILRRGRSDDAVLDPATAAQAARALDVDAVIAISELNGVAIREFGGRSSNWYVLHMYDKNGALVWSDELRGESDIPAGYDVVYNPYVTSVATDIETYVKHNVRAFAVALAKMKPHLDAPVTTAAK
jgi:hypothetical protein